MDGEVASLDDAFSDILSTGYSQEIATAGVMLSKLIITIVASITWLWVDIKPHWLAKSLKPILDNKVLCIRYYNHRNGTGSTKLNVLCCHKA